MKIYGTRVYGLGESIVAASFPKATEFDETKFDHQADVVKSYLETINCGFSDTLPFGMSEEENKYAEKRIRLGNALGTAEVGEAHDCYLCGIVVQANVTAPRFWFPEFQRYHFMDIISSSSTMHCLKKNVETMLADPNRISEFFCDYTDIDVVKFILPKLKELLDKTDKDGLLLPGSNDNGTDPLIARIKAILPEGYLQTVRFTANYRQLKKMKYDRKTHRLQEWRDFCHWIDSLPNFLDLTEKNGN